MWTKIKKLWSSNETILWARLQMFVAAVITVTATIDPSLFANYVPTGYLPIYIFISGVVTELARRYKARDLQ